MLYSPGKATASHDVALKQHQLTTIVDNAKSIPNTCWVNLCYGLNFLSYEKTAETALIYAMRAIAKNLPDKGVYGFYFSHGKSLK